jgi:hypothetical protein
LVVKVLKSDVKCKWYTGENYYIYGKLNENSHDNQIPHNMIRIHCNTIHHSQNLETTHMPYNWWMDQENVVHIHNELLLSHKE